MSNILKRMTTMIKLVVYNQPTVVRRITPYMRFDRLGTCRGIMYITQGSKIVVFCLVSLFAIVTHVFQNGT